ncbi:hypothetical protein DTO212C5_2920 [Paecilomyces variotii]|nr:hypothetical protein DTO212C5_2920 [Paecilomyces variotii]
MYQKESAGILLTSRYILQKIISQDLTYYLILLALFGRGEHRGCAATEDEQIVMPQNVIHVSTGAHLSIEAPRLDRRQPRAVRIGKKKKEAKKKIKSSLKTEQGLRLEEAASREEEKAARKRAKETELRHLAGVIGSSIRTARHYYEQT